MMRGTLVYVGSWDRYKLPPENGFEAFRFDTSSGQGEPLGSYFQQISVGSAQMHPTLNVLYCTDETSTLPGYYQGGGGQLFALRIDRLTGAMTEINHRPSFGSLPSSLAIDSIDGSFLVVTHHTDRVAVTKIERSDSGAYRIALQYDDATTVLFPLDERGAIGEPLDVFVHTGTGGPLRRQTHPQLHSVTGSPSGSFFVVCDKGNDELVCLRINREQKKLETCGPPVKTPPGSSPRYLAFHPKQPFLFVNHETQAIVSSFRYNESGLLEHVVTARSLPADVPGDDATRQSDIAVHPCGRFLYSLIRGLNAVAIFNIDERDGSIARVQTTPVTGRGPRGCSISPDGRFLVIAALESHSVVTHAIESDGSLGAGTERKLHMHPGTITFCQPV